MSNRIAADTYYIGVNDHETDLFEGQYPVPNGMAYNSYCVADGKTAVFDTVDARFSHAWLDNLAEVLAGKSPDYLIIQHMEPDHSGSIKAFLAAYPDAVVVASGKAFAMMKNFFGVDPTGHKLEVKEGDTLSLGRHTLSFVAAPMVHWPEVIVTYDGLTGALFSADAFGKFGALDREEEWDCEARRYYFGIVGKYGAQVQILLKKAAALDIRLICPTHGPVLTENLGRHIALYDTWSSYRAEEEGVFIAYTSVYGGTKAAALLLADRLKIKGCPKVTVCDLARDDMTEAVEDAFRYSKTVLCSTTYNAGVFPFMRDFLERLTERNFSNRTVALVENGSWAPLAAKTMRDALSGCRNLTFIEPAVRIHSALSDESRQALETLSDRLTAEYKAIAETAPRRDPAALYKIGYGLYAVTCNDGRRDNALIVNTVAQVTDNPCRVSVTVNKANYSCHVIGKTGALNACPLTEDAPFALFESFGFRSGRSVDKLEGLTLPRSANGLPFLPQYANSFLSLKVVNSVEFDTHVMFVCEVTESRVLTDKPTMSYAYYHENVKPKPQTAGKKGFVCKICGYVYEGDTLPDDFICPLCKHGAADFGPIE